MTKDLPRILLVSEASLDQERTGLNRTLLNLFAGYPPERFMIYAPQASHRDYPTPPPLDKNIAAFPESFLPYINNRLGLVINPLIRYINFQLLDWLPIYEQAKLANFSPEIVLICPVGIPALLVGYKVSRLFKVPFISYFMDDWVTNNHQRWLSGGLQSLCHKVLEESSAWLMISSQLEKRLVQKFQLPFKRSLIVHNPVDLSNKIFPEPTPHTEKTFRVVYAGSIFSMHYDAIAVVAEAIYELRCSGVDIELVLYTDQSFWNNYQTSWQKWEVIYGSKIPYDQLNQYLQKAKLLLVASSFLPEMADVTSSSVQTKLTDYMVSGIPILACGPTYSACNQFVKTWNCGSVCETNQVSVVKDTLLRQIQNYSALLAFAKNAFEIVQEHFEVSRVRVKLYEFIKQTAQH
jgi:glycosyltransferase involved in cell wall biosynthesis